MQDQKRLSLGTLMATVLLILAGSLLFCYHLGKTNFYSDSPARIAVYARQMNTDGRWLLPVLRDKPRIDIPPLYLWAVKLTSVFSPEVTAFQTRLPAAAGALLLVLLVGWWIYRHVARYGREDLVDTPAEGLALLVGLMLVSNPMLVWFARKGTPDTLFILIYTAAAYCWSESLEARRSFYAGRPWRNWLLYGYLLAGLAMLADGPLVLLLLGVPYWLAARSYHLRRPDWVHAAGLLLALGIGGSWPLLAGLAHPSVARELWRQWLTLRLGSDLASQMSFYEYLGQVALAGLPWIILAAVMAVRVWRKLDRSPTLVFWMCSLLGNLIVLSILSFYVGRHLLPVLVFTVLLAGDGLYRWNFENRAAVLWRVLLRVLLVFFFAVGFISSLLLSSELGLTLFILLPIVWLGWFYARLRQGLHYSPWENTHRLTAIMTLLLVAFEAVLLSNWEPRWTIHNDTLTYFLRIHKRLPDREAQIYLHRDGMSILYDYYLGVQPVRRVAVDRLPVVPDRGTVLFADRDMSELVRDPRLDPRTFYWGSGHGAPREGMFRVLPSAGQATTATAQNNPPRRLPLRVALLGNTGTRSRGQRDVGKRLNHVKGQEPIDDVLLLGNNLWGPSVFDHLNFIRCFEKPFNALLKDGVVFHGALGHEDQGYAWVELRYPPFHMFKQRYYVHSLGGGLVDLFMLDSERLYQHKQFDEAQLAWLERALATSRAPWKVVGRNLPLLSGAQRGAPSKPLADRLLPLFDRHGVQLVAWAGGAWYERLAAPGHAPVFVNAGWSGGARDAHFQAGPPLTIGYDREPGLVIVDFEAGRAALRAIDSKGREVDAATLLPKPAR